MVVEIAIVLGSFFLTYIFIYIAINLNEKQTILKWLFFIIGLFFLLADLLILGNITKTHPEQVLMNSTYNQVTGLTTYEYNTTYPYEAVGNIIISWANVINWVVYLVIAFFMLQIIVQLINKLQSYMR